MILLGRLDSRQRIAGMTLGDGIVVMAMKNSVVEQLSNDIQKGFSDISGFFPDNLWRTHQMYEEYFNPSILEQVVPEFEESLWSVHLRFWEHI